MPGFVGDEHLRVVVLAAVVGVLAGLGAVGLHLSIQALAGQTLSADIWWVGRVAASAAGLILSANLLRRFVASARAARPPLKSSS